METVLHLQISQHQENLKTSHYHSTATSHYYCKTFCSYIL